MILNKTYELKEIHTTFSIDEVNSTEEDIVWIEDSVQSTSLHETVQDAIEEMRLLILQDANIHACEFNWFESGVLSITAHAFNKESPDDNDYQYDYFITEHVVN